MPRSLPYFFGAFFIVIVSGFTFSVMLWYSWNHSWFTNSIGLPKAGFLETLYTLVVIFLFMAMIRITTEGANKK